MEYIEVSAKSVNDCITEACRKLGIPSSKLHYEVLDQGKSGFFGIGAKVARIRAAKKEEGREEMPAVNLREHLDQKAREDRQPASGEEKRPIYENKTSREEKPAADKKPGEVKNPAMAGASMSKDVSQTSKNMMAEEEKEETYWKEKKFKKEENVRKGDFAKKGEKSGGKKGDYSKQRPGGREHAEESRSHIIPSNADKQVIEARAKEFLDQVFGAMELEVDAKLQFRPERSHLDVELSGEQMGLLIGKRGQTLDSLQYLLSLVVNKGEEVYIRVKLDAEDYRKRRKATLENLAKNMAYKAKKTRQIQVLEAMNPYERRIIHSILQHDKYVFTRSEGDEPFRKVIIEPK